jgi:putative ABC transport system substrate-binding protein
MEPKRLEVLSELLPRATTIGYLANPAQANTRLNVHSIQSAAPKIVQRVIVVNASTAAEIDGAFAALARERIGGLLVEGDAFLSTRRSQLIVLAARYGIPAIYFDPGFVSAGGLMSYSDDRAESFRQAGLYIGRILKGEKAGDLPVLQPTKFQFAINLSTAKAIGIEVPATLLVRADEVVE